MTALNATCLVCGGEIHQWDRGQRWFHDTVDSEGTPFDFLDWWRDPSGRHWGVPQV